MLDRSAVGLYGENIMKIAVIGYSGAGKSTLAGMLGEKYSLPVLHLDRLNYSPGWVERPKEAGAAEVGKFLDANPSGWVIDGNYSRWHYERRMEEADRSILLDFIQSRLNAARTGLRIMVIDEFPMNEGGKVLYSRLQEIAGKD